MTKVLVIPGSARKDSVNRKLAVVACKLISEAGGEAELIDPREHVLPLFDQEIEDANGLPETAKLLKRKFLAAEALVFCAPEYNSSITPLLKNLIDWVSRAESDDEPPLAAYQGKVAGLLSASPGGLGGMRGLVHLRSILGNIGVLVLPRQFALSGAYGKFDENGALTDQGALSNVQTVVRELIEVTDKMRR